MEENEGFLYLMVEDSRKLIKIGVSKNPPKREQQLNTTKIPFKVRLIKQIQTPYYKQAEKYLHRLYHNHNVEGEWFSLEPEEITCLMLLTPDHIDELLNRKKIAVRSLTEVIEGSKEIFLSPSENYQAKSEKRKDVVIDSLKSLADDLKSQRDSLQEELIRARLKISNLENPAENAVRNALRSLSALNEGLTENSGAQDPSVT